MSQKDCAPCKQHAPADTNLCMLLVYCYLTTVTGVLLLLMKYCLSLVL